MAFAFTPHVQPAVPILGGNELFPVHRIYCVGKNYAAHIREMGADLREPPCFFLKPADAILLDGHMPYPPGTHNLHYEGELVLALGRGGRNIASSNALDHVFGYAAGLDMTRRDLQTAAGSRGQPWDTGKAFDHSAPLGAIHPLAAAGNVLDGRLQLRVNGTLKQDAALADMIWNCDEIIAELSKLYTLQPGDLIFTGTPAGVGPVVAGDRIELRIEGLAPLHVDIIAA
ncbi:MAG TPA: fumarylacetoacetate hydrolase family protein [Pseudomonadales bacterium]